MRLILKIFAISGLEIEVVISKTQIIDSLNKNVF